MNPTLPHHVPATLVREFDHHRDPAMSVDPFATLERFREERIFWASTFGGFWVPTRFADIRAVLHNPTTFSSRQSSIPAAGWGRPFVPAELDPPEHAKYRALLVHWLAGNTANTITAAVEAACIRLIDSITPTGTCDLAAEFSRPLQNALFTSLFNVPADHAARCAQWVADLLQHGDTRRRAWAVAAIVAYLEQRLAECKLQAPARDGEGLLDTLTRAELNGRPLTDQETLDLAFLVAVASLDTLTQSINFSFRHLADHPEHQRRLATYPAIANQAADELLRLHSVVSVARTATCDAQLAGVHIRKGDRILLCLSLAGRDPDACPSPDTAHFDRPNQSRHLAFGAGPHRCLGARIATRALATALREWHRRIPEYSLPDHAVLRTGGGAVCSLTALPLTWSV